MQKLAKYSLKIVYLPGLKNSVADALSRQPGEASWPKDTDIGYSNSRAHALHDPVVFAAVEDWLKVVVSNLVLEVYIETIKTDCPLVIH